MIEEYDFFDVRKIREFIINYSPNMTLRELFIKLDQQLIQNATSFEKIESFRIKVDDHCRPSSWYPIIRKSSAIGSLFNQLENICALDRDLLT